MVCFVGSLSSIMAMDGVRNTEQKCVCVCVIKTNPSLMNEASNNPDSFFTIHVHFCVSLTQNNADMYTKETSQQTFKV